MEKDLVDSISVKSPCDESWDEMVGTNEVRFCSHCAKNVHNISAISREEIKKLVEKSNGKLCVRYIKNPQGKIYTRPPQTIKFNRKAAIASGVLATSLTLSALAYAQNQQISAKDNSQQTNKSESKISQQTSSLSTVSGVIEDERGAVIPGARVTLQNMRTNKFQVTQSNSEGFYEFKNIELAVYKIEIERDGFEKLTSKDIEVANDIKLNNVLIINGEVVGDLIVVDDLVVKPPEVEILDKIENIKQITILEIPKKAKSKKN